MKKYRVLKPHSWTERPGGGTINGVPGEMAVISDELFAAAPPGTFALLPGEDGYVAPAEPVEAPVAAPEAVVAVDDFKVRWTVAEDPENWTPTVPIPVPSPPKQRKPKAEALKPKPKKRK